MTYPTFTSSATPSYAIDAFGNVDAIAASTAEDDDEVGINLSHPAGLASFTVTWKNCTSCTAFMVHGLRIMDIEICVSDADLDGLQDLVNIDGDNVPNHFDLDSDNDGISDIVPDFSDNQPFVHGYVEAIRPPFLSSFSPSWVDVDKDGLVDLLDEDIFGASWGEYAPLPNTDGLEDCDWRDINTVVILPIELLSCTATPFEREVLLDWETASEKDNDYFILERSDDAQNWHELVEVDAIGNSTSLYSCNWIDKQPQDGVSYYRLKIVDIDNNIEFSHIEVVNRLQSGQILIYPNLLFRQMG